MHRAKLLDRRAAPLTAGDILCNVGLQKVMSAESYTALLRR
jgi:hypothetical protein